MPILITSYDQILTPRGYQYPYTLRPGSPVWTFDGTKYVTVPFDYAVSKVVVKSARWVDFQINQPWKRRWEETQGNIRVIPAGSVRSWVRTHRNNCVMLNDGTMMLADLVRENDELVTIPIADLVGIATAQEYLPPMVSANQLVANLSKRRVNVSMQIMPDIRGSMWTYTKPSAPLYVETKRECLSLNHVSENLDELSLLWVNHQVIHDGLIIGTCN